MRRALRASVAAACIALAAAPPATLAETTLRALSPLDVRVARAEQFSRIEFRWQGSARMSAQRDGQTLTLRFSRDARPDLADLKAVPLRWLKKAEARHERGALIMELTLADGADAKVGDADGANFVNLFEKRGGEAPAD